MLLSNKTKVKWNSANKNHFINKNYIFTKMGDEFEVDIQDLTKGSESLIKIQCDYCGNTIETKYNNYIKQKKNSLVNKDSCNKCKQQKIEEANMIKYGVKSTLSIKEIHKQTEDAHRIDFNIVKKAFTDCGYILLSTTYKRAKDKLKYICLKHSDKIRYITYDDLKQGSGCFECGKEIAKEKLRKYKESDLISICNNNNLTFIKEYNIKENRYIEVLCNIHPNEGIQRKKLGNFLRGQYCRKCASIKGAEKIKGEKSKLWKGGISPILIYLREFIKDWKKESMLSCDFRCDISGDKFDEIHHLYPFSKIIEEVFAQTGLLIKQAISDYTNKEIDLLIEATISIHKKYPLGICLRKDIHKLFHSMYGKNGQYTVEDYYEFKKDYLDKHKEKSA